MFLFFFFFNDTATTEIYTLSLHDALPILVIYAIGIGDRFRFEGIREDVLRKLSEDTGRSEEHTSELQSLAYLVCRLLLEKKKNIGTQIHYTIKTHVSCTTPPPH